MPPKRRRRSRPSDEDDDACLGPDEICYAGMRVECAPCRGSKIARGIVLDDCNIAASERERVWRVSRWNRTVTAVRTYGFLALVVVIVAVQRDRAQEHAHKPWRREERLLPAAIRRRRLEPSAPLLVGTHPPYPRLIGGGIKLGA